MTRRTRRVVPEHRPPHLPSRPHVTRCTDRVAGAMLVAPADIGRPDADDPYAQLAWSHDLAVAWRARFVNVGAAGHVNSASGLGTWPEGRRILLELVPTA